MIIQKLLGNFWIVYNRGHCKILSLSLFHCAKTSSETFSFHLSRKFGAKIELNSTRRLMNVSESLLESQRDCHE